MPKNAPSFPFPQDLRDAQVALLHAQAAYAEYVRTLPWSVEPLPGWTSDKQLHSSYRSERADSPGYTEEQRVEDARLRAELLDLSTVVSTHPFWETVDRGDLVAARMALKHAHEASPAEV